MYIDGHQENVIDVTENSTPDSTTVAPRGAHSVREIILGPRKTKESLSARKKQEVLYITHYPALLRSARYFFFFGGGATSKEYPIYPAAILPTAGHTISTVSHPTSEREGRLLKN